MNWIRKSRYHTVSDIEGYKISCTRHSGKILFSAWYRKNLLLITNDIENAKMECNKHYADRN